MADRLGSVERALAESNNKLQKIVNVPKVDPFLQRVSGKAAAESAREVYQQVI